MGKENLIFKSVGKRVLCFTGTIRSHNSGELSELELAKFYRRATNFKCKISALLVVNSAIANDNS